MRIPMTRCRILLITPLLLIALSACNRNQPSGVPETQALPATATPAPPPAPPPAAVITDAPSVTEAAPPPLDSPIPAYEKTGFPDCDDYIEAYRQCLNTRLGSDERKTRGQELHAAFRAISANVARGVDPARVAALCKKSRKLAANKLTDLGCSL